MTKNTKRDQSKSEILRFAEKRFSKHGYHKTTLDEIARDVRMGKASLYYHFTGKEDLYKETLFFSLNGFLTTVKTIFNNDETSLAVRFEQYLELRLDFVNMYPLLQFLIIRKISGTATIDENTVFTSWKNDETELLYLFFSAHTQNEKPITRDDVAVFFLRLCTEVAGHKLYLEFLTPLRIKEQALAEYRKFTLNAL